MRSMPRAAALFGLLGMATVVLAACGGGDDNEPASTGTPAAAATVESRYEVEALLMAASLQQEDWPEGYEYALNEQRFTTNEESAAEESDYPGGPTQEDLDGFGRLLGYRVSYSVQSVDELLGGTTDISVTTNAHQDSRGASDYLEFERRRFSDPKLVEALYEQAGGEVGDVRQADITPMTVAEVGDQRYAFELRLTVHQTDLDRDLEIIVQSVYIQRDRLLGYVDLFAIGAPSAPGPKVDDLARALDERMKDALE